MVPCVRGLFDRGGRLCPRRQEIKAVLLAPEGKAQAAAEKQGRLFRRAAAVFMIPHKGKATACKLHSYLVAAPGIQLYPHKGTLARFQQTVGRRACFTPARGRETT